MKVMLISTALATALPAALMAQSSGAIEQAVYAGIALLSEGPGSVTIDRRSVGGDQSVTLHGVRAEDGDGFVIEAEFITLAPAETPGHVTVTMSDTVNIQFTPEDDVPPVDLVLASDGFALTTNWILGAGGQPEMAIVADTLALTGGSSDHPVLKDLTIAQTALDMAFQLNEDTRDAAGGWSADTLVLNYSFVDATIGSTMSSTSQTEGIDVSFAGTNFATSEDAFEAFVAEGSFELEARSERSQGSFETDDPDFPIAMTGGSEGGTLTLDLTDGVMELVSNGDATAYVVTPGGGFPMPPTDLGFSSFDMEMRVPLMPTDGAERAKYLISLQDLVVGDGLWDLIDPERTVSRAPATLELDLEADVVLEVPTWEAMEALDFMDGGAFENVNLRTLLVSAAGALVEASGQVAFDNSGPVPVPQGAIDVAVTGVQELGQKLVALGLVEQMQVGMMMGMMMAFAEPGEEPDSFNSRIEFTPDGILANGQPIQ
ncbi:MAG: DUF2125 domain-containing protein [Pseudomonadota bacterium]